MPKQCQMIFYIADGVDLSQLRIKLCVYVKIKEKCYEFLMRYMHASFLATIFVARSASIITGIRQRTRIENILEINFSIMAEQTSGITYFVNNHGIESVQLLVVRIAKESFWHSQGPRHLKTVKDISTTMDLFLKRENACFYKKRRHSSPCG